MIAKDRTKAEQEWRDKRLGPCPYIEGWITYPNGQSIYHMCPPQEWMEYWELKGCWWNRDKG